MATRPKQKKTTRSTRKKVITSNGKARTKSEVFTALADSTGLARKEVASVFDGMRDLIKKDISKKGPGIFTVPGLVKLQVVRKAATKKRKGINPFTGEEAIFQAKPARNVVKARPLKGLKELV